MSEIDKSDTIDQAIYHDWLVNEITEARVEADESRTEHANSYGAGFDAGCVSGLVTAFCKLIGEDNSNEG